MAVAGWTRPDMLLRYTKAQASARPPRRPAGSTWGSCEPQKAQLSPGGDACESGLPGGHRLIRFGRELSAPASTPIWRDHSTIGPNVSFAVEFDPENREWQVCWFECKTCRDQGVPSTSSAPGAEIRDAVDEAWQQAQVTGRPRRTRLPTTPER